MIAHVESLIRGIEQRMDEKIQRLVVVATINGFALGLLAGIVIAVVMRAWWIERQSPG